MTADKREIPTPSNWHWAITPQQVTEIKQGNRDTINKVYFDNLPQFRKVVYNLSRKLNALQLFDDFLQQLYLDLPRYCYDNTKTFYKSIKNTCRRIAWGSGLSVATYKCISLQTPINDDKKSRCLADIVSAPAMTSEN